jgi:hypothetical protein
MQPLGRSIDHPQGDAVAFIAQLIRFQRRVCRLSQQLDRLEAEMRQSLRELARERYEASR